VAGTFAFTATLWTTPGDAAWYMAALPQDVADEIEARYAGPRRGFGAIRVGVTVGRRRWETSIFPDHRLESYVLPVKRSVREAEGLDEGVPFDVTLEVPDFR
jgi:hypothetical protein